jgi:general secretion pathway protein G
VAGTFVTNMLFDRLAEGQVNGAKIQIGQFKQLLQDYRRYCGVYPTTEQGLDALIIKPETCPNWPASGFIEGGKLPKDPWDQPYGYESPDGGKSYIITSFGTDRAPEGEGNAKDIKSNEL